VSRDESFLGRWSRRKVEARTEPAPAAPPAPAVADGALPAERPAGPAPAEPLPELDTLRGLQSEYDAFMRPGVDDGTRRAALKKLFSDPHFNQMDGLDVYIDDYGKFEPMSAAVAASLAVNKYLAVVDHLESEQQRIAQEARSATAVSADGVEPAEPAPAPVDEPPPAATESVATSAPSDPTETA